MKAVKQFNEFIESGVVKKQTPDRSRAKFLVEEARNSYEGLMERIEIIPISEKNANSIVKDCYDIIIEIIRAHMLIKGYNSSGQGAHEAEVSFMRNLDFKETEVQFTDQIRYFRNGMIYYGKIINKEYAEKVVIFMKRIYKTCMNRTNTTPK